MKKSLSLVSILIIVIALVGGGYYYAQMKDTDSVVDTNQNEKEIFDEEINTKAPTIEATYKRTSPLKVLPHTMKDSSEKSPNDVGTVNLSFKDNVSFFPFLNIAHASSDDLRRVITYIDKDIETGINQLYLYVLNTDERIKLTNGTVPIKEAHIIDSPTSVVIYIADLPSPSIHVLSLADLSDRYFPTTYEDEDRFAISADGTKLAGFKFFNKQIFIEELQENFPLIQFTLTVRDMLSPSLKIIKEYDNPVAYSDSQEAKGNIRGITSDITWNSDGNALYLNRPRNNSDLGWKIIEYNLLTEKSRDIFVYGDEYFLDETGFSKTGSGPILRSPLYNPFNNTRLFYTTYSSDVTIDRTNPDGLSESEFLKLWIANTKKYYFLNELDTVTGKIITYFRDVRGALFSSNSSKIYVETVEPEGFAILDYPSGKKTFLFSQNDFRKEYENSDPKKTLLLIGFGLTENELILKEGNNFYYYDIKLGKLNRLFSSNPALKALRRG